MDTFISQLSMFIQMPWTVYNVIIKGFLTRLNVTVDIIYSTRSCDIRMVVTYCKYISLYMSIFPPFTTLYHRVRVKRNETNIQFFFGNLNVLTRTCPLSFKFCLILKKRTNLLSPSKCHFDDFELEVPESKRITGERSETLYKIVTKIQKHL